MILFFFRPHNIYNVKYLQCYEIRSGSYAVAGYTLGMALCLLTYTAYIMQVQCKIITENKIWVTPNKKE